MKVSSQKSRSETQKSCWGAIPWLYVGRRGARSERNLTRAALATTACRCEVLHSHVVRNADGSAVVDGTRIVRALCNIEALHGQSKLRWRGLL